MMIIQEKEQANSDDKNISSSNSYNKITIIKKASSLALFHMNMQI